MSYCAVITYMLITTLLNVWRVVEWIVKLSNNAEWSTANQLQKHRQSLHFATDEVPWSTSNKQLTYMCFQKKSHWSKHSSFTVPMFLSPCWPLTYHHAHSLLYSLFSPIPSLVHSRLRNIKLSATITASYLHSLRPDCVSVISPTLLHLLTPCVRFRAVCRVAKLG